ncbi:hypothetical protein CROQUDRAFT_410098 [Cronartium quercuum f. sp. fusiforme G11]|uniref:Uncharacterized protein n=1 Tax=Cronartium quercuum f. sp. fusiforme G11 TaxID=708437 RepID=A0A9P6NQD9_9BASI|nr:hypothetical protein CROQUDRAFT_410098 [Cronartium quercuum f. sp. fusiforme G11]
MEILCMSTTALQASYVPIWTSTQISLITFVAAYVRFVAFLELSLPQLLLLERKTHKTLKMSGFTSNT